MDQSHTNTPTDESPQDFRLARGYDGWGGGNRNFRVVGNMIKIKNSDADPNILPTEQQRRKMYDESGNYSQHVQQYQKDPVFQLWMSKVGPYLADWVLDKRPSNDPTARTIPWKMIGFPAGYTLWVHLTGDRSDPANPRTDAYLYGAPHKIFRSPMEFVEHAIWLMKGGSETDVPCQCKYCTPGQSQRAINRRLNHGDEDEEDEDSDGGGGATATIADINATRHRLFRNRPGAGAIAAANATARRRGTKRERSPVSIKAKDYRVGNQDGGAGADGGAGGAAV